MRFLTILSLVVMLMFTAGCSWARTSDKAREIYEQQTQESEEARQAWQASKEEVELLLEQGETWQKAMQDAQERKDWSAFERAKAQVEITAEAWETARTSTSRLQIAWEKTTPLVQKAGQDLEDAESTDDYLGTILGWGLKIFGVGGAGVGLLGLGQRRKRVDLEEASRITANNVTRYVPEDKLESFKNAQAGEMSARARKAFSVARKG